MTLIFLIVKVRLPTWIFDKKKLRPEVLTLSKTFYNLSVPGNHFEKAEMPQFGGAGTEGLCSLGEDILIDKYMNKRQKN